MKAATGEHTSVGREDGRGVDAPADRAALDLQRSIPKTRHGIEILKGVRPGFDPASPERGLDENFVRLRHIAAKLNFEPGSAGIEFQF